MSHWDKLELFSAADAASLVTGDDKSETKALLNQMRDAYENAVGETFTKHFEIRHPHSQANPKPVRYHSITDPLPEGLLYSRALDMQSGLLFRPDPEEVSCKFLMSGTATILIDTMPSLATLTSKNSTVTSCKDGSPFTKSTPLTPSSRLAHLLLTRQALNRWT